MDKEMLAALEADGLKLKQLTGEDHGPWFLEEVEVVDYDQTSEANPSATDTSVQEAVPGQEAG